MILVDANLLIYAIDKDSPQHKPARKWIEAALSGSDTVGLAWGVILAFLRLTTRPGILQRPMSADQAIAYVDEWLALPNVEIVQPGETHWSVFRNLLHAAGSAGNLTSDAHLAALAIERGATLCSADNDFRRFPGLRHENPLARGGARRG
ncbi:MAG: type II toxin-antitoxin system VapC family toxin [Vicinamibacteria bacterium]|nr:type II toxin-antitoxin system VapC family toxin [Vicinamibacteria bacterium]